MCCSKRILAVLLAGVLAAGPVSGPVRVMAEEAGEVQEEELPEEELCEQDLTLDRGLRTEELKEASAEDAEETEEDSEEGPEENSKENLLEDWETDIYATELELFDDPASESVISVSTGGGRKARVKKWTAVEIGEDGESAGEVDYPFDAPGSSLSTLVKGDVLAGLVGTEKDVEIYALLAGEDGSEQATDPVCITIHRITEEVSCDIENLRLLPGGESQEFPSVTVYLQNTDFPLGEYYDAEILGAGVKDPSVAKVSFSDGMLTAEGIKTGTTGAWLTYIHPDGDVRRCPFTITVAQALYDVSMEESFEEYEMLLGDRSEIRVLVSCTSEDACREMEDDELDVVWELKALNPEEEAEGFALEADGTSAVLSVVSEAVPGVEKQILVTAHVFLKGSEEEIGTISTEHGHIDREDIFMAEDTLPDTDLEVGESFTIRPFVISRAETGNGEVSSEHNKRARFGLIFDPAQVRVTDQNGREVEPAWTNEEGILHNSREDGIVYTVTRLTGEEIEVTAAAAWPAGDDEYEVYLRDDGKNYYIGSLEGEEDEDDPESAGETTSRGTSGRDISSSKGTGTAGRAGAGQKPATGDDSHSGMWILFAAASLAACITAAGVLKKKAE